MFGVIIFVGVMLQTVGITDVFSLLSFIVNAGAAVVLSFVFERWPWYQLQGPQLKSTIFLGAVILLSLLAQYLLGVVDAQTNSLLAPYVVILVNVIGAWLAGQGAHYADRKLSLETAISDVIDHGQDVQ